MGFSGSHFLLLSGVILVLFGPKELPTLLKVVGKALAGLRTYGLLGRDYIQFLLTEEALTDASSSSLSAKPTREHVFQGFISTSSSQGEQVPHDHPKPCLRLPFHKIGLTCSHPWSTQNCFRITKGKPKDG